VVGLPKLAANRNRSFRSCTSSGRCVVSEIRRKLHYLWRVGREGRSKSRNSHGPAVDDPSLIMDPTDI
jgi:hypothetical protein